MDISYLLWLQGIREGLPAFVEQFFVVISAIAANPALIVVPALIYWCIDKRGGQFLLFSFSIGTLVNQFIKNTVCCYRPWIRSPSIHPAEGALAEATGYSFPSGHTQAATSLIGAAGWYFRKRSRAAFVVAWVFVLLVAFSRNFLGVHTPQDVVVGLVEAIVLMYVAQWLLAWVDKRSGRDTLALTLALAVTVVYLIYVVFKPYPMTYDAAGALLVDPVEMQVDCFGSAGAFSGAFLGWFLERKFVNFSVDARAGWKRWVIRLVVGIVVVGALYLCGKLIGSAAIGVHWGKFLQYFLAVVGAAFAAPAVFSAIERRWAQT